MKSIICALALVSVSTFAADHAAPAATGTTHTAPAATATATTPAATTATAPKMDCKHAKTEAEKKACATEGAKH